jgi:hypothetical protein
MSATIVREVFYSSVRFGLYTNIKDALLKMKQSLGLHCMIQGSADGHGPTLTFFDKLAAGMITGAIGSAIANPTDLVKIRMQHDYGLRDAKTGLYRTGPLKGRMPAYQHTFDAFVQIARQDGFGMQGWMRGVYATMTRAALITGGQLASYESGKAAGKAHAGMQEGPLLHTLCSIWSGLVAATFCAPADIVKTRLMCSNPSDTASSTCTLSATSLSPRKQHVTAWQCFKDIVRTEGILGLYRGWLPSYLRLAPHFIIALPLNEQIRLLFGLSTL